LTSVVSQLAGASKRERRGARKADIAYITQKLRPYFKRLSAAVGKAS
jgi:hypothetical protein